MSTYLKRIPVSVALLLGLFLASSCGVENAPLSSTDAEVQVAPENAGLLVFGFGDEPAAKKVKGAKRSKTAKVGKKGGTLLVGDANKSGGKDDIKAQFTVDKGALENKVEITITLYGDELEDLVVGFAPAGLVFNKKKPAELIITVGEDLYDDDDLDKLVVTHGEDEVSFEVKIVQDGIEITIKILGFSRYSLGA
jgi:hypothetical protein